jgi:hypothetical protein
MAEFVTRANNVSADADLPSARRITLAVDLSGACRKLLKWLILLAQLHHRRSLSSIRGRTWRRS